MRVIVHGGARMDESRDGQVGPDRAAGLDAAAAAGADAATPLDGVETAVRRLESDPEFNAGTGGAVQSDGVVRTDAGLMTGEGVAGAACAMPGVEHAVSVARLVGTETPHVLVAGRGAVDLAAGAGIPTDVDLTTEATRERWASADPPASRDADHLAWVRERFGGTDTVGAVAVHGGRVAAATSTGGRWFALAGRVGDVPQIGAGVYCSPAGGASATGAGEAIARDALARRAVGHLADGLAPGEAATRAIDGFADRTGATAGVIVAADGVTAGAHNAAGMETATAAREPGQ